MNTSTTVDIDLGGSLRKQDVHEQLALALGFPNYCQQSWEGFWDCVHTLDEMPQKIRIKGMKALNHSFPLEAALLRKYLEDFTRTAKGAQVEVTFE
jgi:RNAse (barnase) inhibitor barstar